MRITRTLAGGLCAAVTAALLTLGSAAAAPQSFLDDVTVGEVLTAASRLHAAYTGEGEAKDIFAKNGDYSSVLRYAESSGILSAADSYDCAEKATRVDLAKLLYTALPESQYPEINENYRRISDMSVLSDGYEEVLALCRAGVFSGVDEEGNFEPNGTVTAAQLNEIVQMVGMDALSPSDRLKLEAARSIREDYLHQNAFDEVDTYTSLNKQYLLMELILAFYDKSLEALGKGAAIEKIVAMSSRERIGRFKYADEKQTESEYNEILSELDSDIDKAVKAKDED